MRRSREIPIVRPARSASGWTLASGLRSALGADGAACSIAAAGWSIGAAGALAACWPGGSPIGVARSESPLDAEGTGASRRCDTFTSGDFGETVGLVGHDERIDQPVDVTV